MMQGPIDLLPESIRQRSQARQRTARFILAGITAVMVLSILAAHARMRVQRGQARLAEAESRAADVLDLEVRAAGMRLVLDDMETYVRQYEEVALPLPITAILATLINTLPDSVTLTKVTMDAAHRRAPRTPRSMTRDEPAGLAPRVLIAEIGGFAASDRDIAELVERLSETPPMKGVTLDYSRTRPVREYLAREFRMSFKIDVDARFDLTIDNTTARERRGDIDGATASGREQFRVEP